MTPTRARRERRERQARGITLAKRKPQSLPLRREIIENVHDEIVERRALVREQTAHVVPVHRPHYGRAAAPISDIARGIDAAFGAAGHRTFLSPERRK